MVKNKIIISTGLVAILISVCFIPQISGNKIQNESVLNTQNSSTWIKTFGSEDVDECGSYVLETDDKGLLVLGTKQVGVFVNHSIWLIKTDSNGVKQWEKEFDNGVAHCIIQTRDSGYIIAGNKDVNQCDAWLIKINKNGDIQWEKTFGRENTDYGLNVIQTNDGGYLLTGSTYINEELLGEQIYIVKVDSNGNFLWEKNFGEGDYMIDSGVSSYQTNDGGYIVLGETSIDTSGWTDVVLIKTDSLGNQEWIKVFPTSSHSYDTGGTVIQTDDGGYLFTAEQGIVRYSAVDWDIWLVKTDSEGDIEWEKLIGRRFYEQVGNNLFSTREGNYLVTGSFELVKDSSEGIDDDICLINFDKYGNINWNTFYPTDNEDWGSCVIETSDGGYVIVGSVNDSIDSDTYNIVLMKVFPPLDYKPTKPEGAEKGAVDKSYSYSSTAVEPSGKDIYYLWDWGDGFTTGWIGPYKSGETCTVSHKWVGQKDWKGYGTYPIRVKVKTDDGMESSWSDPLIVVMPRDKTINSQVFKIIQFFSQLNFFNFYFKR
ncbi:hypothetical protein DRN69_04740 [Candidatus Pacearchaeota archaeon]|nr:MAG: hypothetical protein DRN24_03650 [Thermoplasmata archaeon]RLG14008.1 MAG: hypothetical protein DRN69_04740 [Candidatus Pacearchaeota archaeon]